MPQFQSHLSNALDAVSGDIGSVAAYKAEQEKQQVEESFAERRQAAQMAYTAALEHSRMAMEENHFTRTEAGKAEDDRLTMDYRNRALAADTDYHTKSLDRETAHDNTMAGLEKSRLGIEQQRADNDKTFRADSRKGSVLGSQLTASNRRIDFYRKQQEAALSKAGSSMADVGDPNAAARERDLINQKYQRLIDSETKAQEPLKAKFGEVMGVDWNDTATQQMDADGNPVSDSANPDGTPVAGLPTAADAAGNDPTLTAPVQPAATPAQQPPPGAPPGARQAPDGNWYAPDPARPGKYLKVG